MKNLKRIRNLSLGRDEPCPWGALIKVPLSTWHFEYLKVKYALQVRPAEYDASFGIQKFDSPTRPFWIRRGGQYMDGKHLLTFILAEEDWIMANSSEHQVRRGMLWSTLARTLAPLAMMLSGMAPAK